MQVIKVFKQYPIEDQNASPSLLSAAQREIVMATTLFHYSSTITETTFAKRPEFLNSLITSLKCH